MDLRPPRSQTDRGLQCPHRSVTDRGFRQMVSGHKGAPGTGTSGHVAHRTQPFGGDEEGPAVSWVPSFPQL